MLEPGELTGDGGVSVAALELLKGDEERVVAAPFELVFLVGLRTEEGEEDFLVGLV